MPFPTKFVPPPRCRHSSDPPTAAEIAEGEAWMIHRDDPTDANFVALRGTFNALYHNRRYMPGVLRCGHCGVTKWGKRRDEACVHCGEIKSLIPAGRTGEGWVPAPLEYTEKESVLSKPFNFLDYRELLLPCPFCNDDADMRIDPADYPSEHYWVECGSVVCEAASGFAPTPEAAVVLWNRRGGVV